MALVVAEPVFAAGVSAASTGIVSVSSAIRSAAVVFIAGFATSEVKSRWCAKRRPCQLQAGVEHLVGEVAVLRRKVQRQKKRLGALKDVRKKVKKLEGRLRRQRAEQKSMRPKGQSDRQAGESGTGWERVARHPLAGAKAEALRQASQSTSGEGAVGIHRVSPSSPAPAEKQAAVACHPPEDRPSARDIEKAGKLRARHPNRIPVFCTPSAVAAASCSSHPLKLLVPEHMSGDDLKAVLARKLSRGASTPVAAQALTLAIGKTPLQADAPLSQLFDASAGFLHITYVLAP